MEDDCLRDPETKQVIMSPSDTTSDRSSYYADMCPPELYGELPSAERREHKMEATMMMPRITVTRIRAVRSAGSRR